MIAAMLNHLWAAMRSMSQSRPVRSVHRAEGWTPELIVEHAAPALKPSLYPLDRSQDAFAWDPV